LAVLTDPQATPQPTLRNPSLLRRCERRLLALMRRLERADLERELTVLTPGEIDGLLARRDAIVKLLDERLARDGEDRVVYTYSHDAGREPVIR
jgi:hypothetical protein